MIIFKKVLMFIFITLLSNFVLAQQEVKVPRPEFKEWPCFYVDGKPETYNLEKHMSSGNYTNILPMSMIFTSKGIPEYVLEGSSSGVKIKSSDSYAFAFRKNNAKITEEIEMNKDVFKNLSLQQGQMDSMLADVWKDAPAEFRNKKIQESKEINENSRKTVMEEEEKEIIEKYKLKLFRLKVKGNKRTFRENETQVSCSVELLPNDIERIKPIKPLGQGEYGFFYDTINVFTFSIID